MARDAKQYRVNVYEDGDVIARVRYNSEIQHRHVLTSGALDGGIKSTGVFADHPGNVPTTPGGGKEPEFMADNLIG